MTATTRHYISRTSAWSILPWERGTIESVRSISSTHEACKPRFHRKELSNPSRKPRTFSGLPESYGDKSTCTTLEITLKETSLPLRMALTYTVFEDSDVITRRATIYNDGTNSVRIKGLASAQLDLDADDWNLVTFDGAWARERYMNERPLLPESTSMTAKPVSPVPTTTPAYSSRRTTGSASA